MNSVLIQESIEEALRDIKVVDPHCHLSPSAPQGSSLDRVLLYHHVWIELVSAGMDPFTVSKAGLPHEGPDPEMGPFERVRNVLPWLPMIDNTVLGYFIRLILRDVYQVDELTRDNYEAIVETSLANAADPAYPERLLKGLCNIESSISVEGRGTPSWQNRVKQGLELAPVRLSNGKQSPREVLREWERDSKASIRDSRNYRDFLRVSAQKFDQAQDHFVGAWIHPAINETYYRDTDIDAILRKAWKDKALTQEEQGSFCMYGMRHYLDNLSRRGAKTIQVLVGADALPPHRAISAWSPHFSLGMAALANAFEHLHFNISAASDVYTQDLGVLGRHFPNISVAGYWWHTLYPEYIRRSLETRLDMIPMNKICLYFSDAYTAEWCHPKLYLVKDILGHILIERVERGRYTLQTAQRIIEQGFYENPKRIYGL